MGIVQKLDLTDAQSLITVHPLEPTIGAEISGVDLSQPLHPAVRDEIRATLLKYKVIFFRDQPLTAEQHAAFAAEFGPLYNYPITRKDDKVETIHKIAATERTVQRVSDPTTINAGYHTDTSWRLVPAWGAVLRAVHLPKVGGDTIWVDAHAAYEGLSDELKARFEGLYATHDFQDTLRQRGLEYPIVAHPIVRTHRETGEKILWVNFSQRSHIVGVDLAESREILSIILQQYQNPEYQVRFSWRPNSVAFWDNRAAVHYAVRNYGDFPRLLDRILIADDRLYTDL